ncbi:MAG: NADH-quinone oxidoreductase subunit C [Acidimicrobiia bacterium]
MTQSPSESETVTSSPSDTEGAVDPLREFADTVAEAVGGQAMVAFENVKVKVSADRWVETHTIARDDLGLVFFSWLSAIDWANETQTGDPLKDEVVERIEVLTTVADLGEGRRVTFSTDLSHEKPAIDSLVEVYSGANWHEREAHEMFGIDFKGHPDLSHLYLPESFLGTPLRKSYPLLSREVKPWPGTVDVESMPETGPSTENPEA